MGKVIGTYCSVARRNEYIYPKDIPGYIAPEPQVLTEDGQRFTFTYTPIEYNIEYNLNGGSFDDSIVLKTKYTVEDNYIPAAPSKENYTFMGWNPASIKEGTTGDITFVAQWSDNAILVSGSNINQMLDEAFDKTTIMAIQISSTRPDTPNKIDLSSTSIPIYAWYSNGTVMLYSASGIWCNPDMSHAFEGFELLRDINDLSKFGTKSGMNINSIFKGCSLLGDVSAVENWAEQTFIDFTDAFTGTAALEASRVPSWYSWTVPVHYVSSTGKVLQNLSMNCIPGQTLYAPNITAYNADTQSIVITSKDLEYTFTYIPVNYSIRYETDGGTMPSTAKTSYTIEDGEYTPPEAVKTGYTFVKWNPEKIELGDYGNVVFIANYTSE